MTVLGASMMALLILAACNQAERAIGSAVGPRKAIAELQYAGDRPDAPPLEERGNWEGEIRIAAGGSRILVYKFLSDTFEVLDGSDARRMGWVCPYFCNVMHNPVQPGYAVSPDGKSVAISHRRGAAVWDTATDTIRFPLRDPKRKPLPYPMQR